MRIDGNDVITKAPVLRFQQRVTTPREAGSGLLTGRRVHEPITVVRRPDAKSPLFFKALCQNEPLELELTTYSGGTRQFVIEIEGGYVASYEQKTEGSGVIEVLTFVFQTIDITHVPTGTEHQDSWQGAS